MATQTSWSFGLKRAVSDALMAALSDDEIFGWLRSYPRAEPDRFDLQLRADPKVAGTWATLYLGLTGIVNVREINGKLRLTAHDTHRKAGSFDPSWSKGRPAEAWRGCEGLVRPYIEAAVAATHERHYRLEGRVQAVMSNVTDDAYRVVNREVVVAFRDKAFRTEVLHRFRATVEEALRRSGKADKWWPGIAARAVYPHLGSELDALAIGSDGRLLAVEVKPATTTGGITWGPAQAYMYAYLLARLQQETPNALIDAVPPMLAQRVQLGLCAAGTQLARPVRIVPVLAIGSEKLSPKALDRAWDVQEVLTGSLSLPDSLDPFELWLLDCEGHIRGRMTKRSTI
jgi:hypothetical protein